MSTVNRLPPFKPAALWVLLPASLLIPSAYRAFQQHKLLNIIPLSIVEKRPESARDEDFKSPYQNTILHGYSPNSIEKLKNFSFESVGKMHRLCSNVLCPFAGAFTYAVVHRQIKYRLKICTPIERIFFATIAALGAMSVVYKSMMLWAYGGIRMDQKMELKYELMNRIGVWLDTERDPTWREKVRFDEATLTFVPTERTSRFRK